MKTILQGSLSVLACCTAVGWTVATYGADVRPNEKVTVAKSFRASKLTGLHIRNSAGEKLGTVDDLVVNIETGKIAYVAMGVGGVVGLGEKLFAVPFSELKFNLGREKDEMFFVLDIPKEKIEAAPGFDKHNWPNFADPNWSQKIDNYYRRTETTTGRKDVTPK